MKRKILISFFYCFLVFYNNDNYGKISLKDSLKIELKASKTIRDSLSLIKEMLYTESDAIEKQKLVTMLYKLALKNHNLYYQNVSYIFKSKYYEELDNMDSALYFAYLALSNSHKIKNNNQIVNSENQIGRVFYNFFKDDSAEYHYKKGIEYILKNNIKDEYETLGTMYGNLGLIYKYKGKYEESIKYFIKNYEASEKANNIDGMLGTLLDIGSIYTDLRNFPKAEIYLNRVLRQSNQITIHDNLLSLYNELGLLYSHWGKYSQAEYYNKLALAGYKKKNEPLYIWDEYNNLSIIYTAQKKYLEAQKYNNEALKYAEKLENVFYKNTTLINQINIYVQTNQYDKAEEIAKNVIHDTCCIDRIDENNKNTLYNSLYLLYKAKKQYQKSLYYFVEAKKIEDSVNSRKFINKSEEIETKYQTGKKEAEILKLQNKNLKESRTKWILGSILALSFIGLGIFWKLFDKIKTQKDYIEQLQIELHHRIKNNLSIINKFIDDIKSKYSKTNVQFDLTELQNKIDSINTVHRQLYTNPGKSDIRLRDYVNSLAKNIVKSFNQKIEIQNQIDTKINISIEKIFPIGLIINEFITNSFKHGFKNVKKPVIMINAQVENNQLIKIEIRDNGVGYIQKDDTHKTLGLRMMNLLAAQLDASLSIISDQGTLLILNFVKL